MRKFLAAACSAAVLFTAVPLATTEASAASVVYRDSHRGPTVVVRTSDSHRHYKKKHHRPVCRVITKKRIIWNHGVRKVITTKKRVCDNRRHW